MGHAYSPYTRQGCKIGDAAPRVVVAAVDNPEIREHCGQRKQCSPLGAWKGFLQFFYRPHYWEKTVHGLDVGVEPEYVHGA